MTSPTDLPTQDTGFQSLDELCDAMNRIVRDYLDVPVAWDHRFPRNAENHPDFTKLPCFADFDRFPVPTEALAWDERREIVADDIDPFFFRIRDRADIESTGAAPAEPDVIFTGCDISREPDQSIEVKMENDRVVSHTITLHAQPSWYQIWGVGRPVRYARGTVEQIATYLAYFDMVYHKGTTVAQPIDDASAANMGLGTDTVLRCVNDLGDELEDIRARIGNLLYATFTDQNR